MDINDIKYGSPDIKLMTRHARATRGDLRDIIPELATIRPRPNNKAGEELEFMMELERSLLDEFIDEADVDFRESFQSELGIKLKDVDRDGSTEAWLDQAHDLIGHLKVHHNRPRPYQMASMLGVDMHPMKSISAHSPSFPSGHTAQAILYALALAPSMNEDERNRAVMLAVDIAQSRIEACYHFPTDNEYGLQVAKRIAAHWSTPRHMRDLAWLIDSIQPNAWTSGF